MRLLRSGLDDRRAAACGVAAGSRGRQANLLLSVLPARRRDFQDVTDLAGAAHEESDRELLRAARLQPADQFLDRIGQPSACSRLRIKPIGDRDIVQRSVAGIGDFDAELDAFADGGRRRPGRR